MPRWIRNLRAFGETGIVKKSGHVQKVENKGMDCVMVGHGVEHGAGTFRMMNLEKQSW